MAAGRIFVSDITPYGGADVVRPSENAVWARPEPCLRGLGYNAPFFTAGVRMKDCPICAASGEEVLWRNDRMRVIAVHGEANAPAFCRVIWHAHVAEMTDLSAADRYELMETVCHVERAMRRVLRPAKINLASLGNVVPHLHWHVIARFADDACFPAPIWAAAERESAVSLPEGWTRQVAAILADEAGKKLVIRALSQYEYGV